MKWIKQVNVLSKIAAVEPHAAYLLVVLDIKSDTQLGPFLTFANISKS